MGDVSVVRRRLGMLMACAALCAGCGGDSTETEPAEEPNAGPGIAAGGGKAEKGSPFGAGGKTEKAASEKPADKKK
jgi:hypothetical protein